MKVPQLKSLFIGGACALLTLAGTASANPELRDLGHGWQVYISDAGMVDIGVKVSQSTPNTLVLEKFVTYSTLAPVELIFTQTASNANTATRFVIAEEYIANRSGADWNFYCNQISDAVFGDATWNTTASSGVSISPFSSTEYTQGNRCAEFSGGIVLDRALWFIGLSQGAQVLDITLNPNDDPAERTGFVMRGIPQAIPTPGAAVLFLAGAIMATRRRR